MRRIIFKICGMFHFSLLTVFLLLALCAVSAPAQAGDSSVFIFSKVRQGEAGVVADHLTGQLGKGLLNQYPCIDFIDEESLRALVGWEKWRQLLGGEPNEETMINIGNAVGARYLIMIDVIVSASGMTTVSARVLDTQAQRTIANRLESAPTAEEALESAAAVAKSILQDMSSRFNKRCEPHWVGTITYTKLRQISKTENWKGSSSGALIPNVDISQTTNEQLMDATEILLQAQALGKSGDTTRARVQQRYEHRWERLRSESGTAPCREPGRNPYRKELTGEEKEFRNETGAGTQTVSVVISVSQTGKYRIKIYRLEHLKTTGKYERSGHIMGCKPVPFSSVSETEGTGGVGYIDLEGEVDPQNVDLLVGQKTEGDLETGQETWSWNLRLVKPKTKK